MNVFFSHIWNIFVTNRYWIASLLLVVVMASFTVNGGHGADFWEHSAVVKELATHPLSPQHPLFKANKPHMFFSPYLLFVGLFSRLGSFNAIDTLAIVGVVNLLFLLISLRLFIQCFFHKSQDAIGFYALILVLFLWPAEAWGWSGFIHFKVLGFVLPYPSTFAIASTFLIFALYHHALTRDDKWLLLSSGILATVVILTHLPTAVVMFIGILAISLHFYNKIGLRALAIGLVLSFGIVLLAFLWPYYSFFDLVTLNSSGKTKSQPLTLVMYERVSAIWPTLFLSPFALPSLISRLRVNKYDAFFLMLCATVLTYALGYVVGYFTGLYVLGRTISFVAVFIQIALAARLAQLEIEMKAGKFWPALPVIFVCVMIMCTVALNSPNKTALYRAYMGFQGLRHIDQDYEALGRYVEQYDVILADIQTSWKIPTFNGKVVVAKHPIPFIDDHIVRRRDVDKFFSNEVDAFEKASILNQYQVDYLFINKSRNENAQDYLRFGNLIYESENFLLIKTLRGKGKQLLRKKTMKSRR